MVKKKEKIRMPKRKAKKKPGKEFSGFSEKGVQEVEVIARRIISEMVLPFEHAIRQLNVETDNMRANLVATTTILEHKKVFDRDEYLAIYNQYMTADVGIVEEDGSMHGRIIFSLYNVGEIK